MQEMSWWFFLCFFFNNTEKCSIVDRELSERHSEHEELSGIGIGRMTSCKIDSVC